MAQAEVALRDRSPSRWRLIAVLARGRWPQLAGLGVLLLAGSALPLAGIGSARPTRSCPASAAASEGVGHGPVEGGQPGVDLVDTPQATHLRYRIVK